MQPFVKGTNIELRGTLETVSGVAAVESVDADGSITYSGETDIWWDEQKTVEENGQRIWLDHEGNEYPESDVEFR